MGEPERVNFGASVEVPQTPRPRTCCRCAKIADTALKKGWTVPPVAEAESWVVQGRRYWAGLCWRCSEVEKSEREARRQKQGAA